MQFCTTGKCKPCFEAKTSSTVASTAGGILYYTADTNFAKQKIGDWTTFFDSLDGTALPYCDASMAYDRYKMDTCSLKKQGCVEDYMYNPSEGRHILMDTDPVKLFKMTMDNNVIAGYTETFCIKCSSSGGIYQTYEHTVTQKEKVDCS